MERTSSRELREDLYTSITQKRRYIYFLALSTFNNEDHQRWTTAGLKQWSLALTTEGEPNPRLDVWDLWFPQIPESVGAVEYALQWEAKGGKL